MRSGSIGYTSCKRRREEPADHAGDLQRELLRRGEPVDPVVDDPLEAVGDTHARQVDARRDPALAALESEQAGLPQGQRKLLAVERIPLGFLEDQLLDGTGQGLDAQPLAGEGQRILVREVAEPEDIVGQLEQVLVLLGKARDLEPRRDDQHRLARLPGDLQRQGPGGRVEPVGVVDHQERRPARRGPAQQAEQQVVGVVGPDLAGHAAVRSLSGRSSGRTAPSSGASDRRSGSSPTQSARSRSRRASWSRASIDSKSD